MTVCDFTAIIIFVVAIGMIALTDSEELILHVRISFLSTFIAFCITKLVYNSHKSYNDNNDGDLIEKIANFIRC